MEKLEKFLSKIGLDAATLTALKNEETDQAKIEEFAVAFVANQKKVVSNDPELMKTLRDEIRGTELSKIEHKIKKTFNLSAEDLKDKKFDEIIEVAFDKSKVDSTSGNEELQTKIIELNKKVKEYEEEIVPGAKASATATINKFRQDLALRDALSKKNLIVGAEVVIPVIESFLSSNYKIEVNEAGSLEVKTKEGLNPLNSDGTKVVTFDELIDSQLNALQLIKQSNAQPGQPGQPGKPNLGIPNPGNEAPKFNLRGLDAAAANVETLGKVKEFGK